MPRLPRFVLPGQPQHVIQRGNNRQNIFRKDSDYEFYLEKLLVASRKHQCDIHAYVLMTNHVHLIVTPHTEDGISKMMQTLGRYYVQYFNYCYHRTGTLWEGRYRATLIDSERYLLICMRYIELNPVRAKGMVDHPSKYIWSSYACNALGEYDELVTEHDEFRRLGNTGEKKRLAYRSLFKSHLSIATLASIRESTNNAWVLGSDSFKTEVQHSLKRSVESKGHGGDRRSEHFRSTSLIP